MRTLLCVLLLMVSACSGRDHRLRVTTAGGKGPPTVVLLHGFGSTAERWLPFAQTIRLPQGPRQIAFMFPEGPYATTPPEGPKGGRAWWHLDLASYIGSPGGLPDLSRGRPDGLDEAVRRISAFLKAQTPLIWGKGEPLVLGGFSQGAIVSLETALTTKAPLVALILLSGTIVDEAHLVAALPPRRGLPVFIAHGRSDQVLPFAIAERLAHHMKASGLSVTWFPFDGGHEIPAIVVDELNRFVAAEVSQKH